jgi:microcin C transport system permease protein
MVDNNVPKVEKPKSVFQRRWAKFRSLKRGWYSFLLLLGALLLSFANPLLINNRALVVSYDGGLYSPIESLLKDPSLPGTPPHAPDSAHWMGTDDRARDVFARMVYGFRLSMLFGLALVTSSYIIGITIGAVLGYFGGKVDILGQRLVEIWAGIPFLYTVIIISSIIQPTPWLLVGILAVFSWIGISYYVRGEFYREKAKDYVAAAVATGESDAAIIFRHILPNTLTPVISTAPFALIGGITALVSLDFLGFGVPAPTPSWGELMHQGRANLTEWHLVLFPLGAQFVTLLMVVFIGEAVREAFDPKTYSRLR